MIQPQNFKILVVEDEAIHAEPLISMLQTQGYQLTKYARTGAEALAIFNKEHPHLALIDIGLPIDGDVDWDGIETASHILENRKIPIIFITAHSEQSMVDKALKVIGADKMEYLTKPYKDRDLQIKIQKELLAFYPPIPQKIIHLKDKRGKSIAINTENIVYIERKEHNIHVITINQGTFSFSDNLTIFEKGGKHDFSELSNFIRIHRSFIVNTQHIKASNLEITRAFVTLFNNKNLPVKQNIAILKTRLNAF